MTEASKEIRKWQDEFMFEAEEIDADNGPEVFLISCNNDPLGSIAAAAKAYVGEFVESLAQITDEERRHYLGEVRKTALAMPLESVNFHFRIKGVTRGFTHQMVRQRTAAYSQESTRFAVKTKVPVGLPPSLMGTESRESWRADNGQDGFVNGVPFKEATEADFLTMEERYASPKQRARFEWDEINGQIEKFYNRMVDNGWMPAEDARGILPTNLLTQLNYFTNLRNLQVEAGKRLCTQAQFEWRIVLTQLVGAIREYGKSQEYLRPALSDDEPQDIRYRTSDFEPQVARASSQWQFDALADIFRPVCYNEGKCPFKADFDRKCSIRGRVDKFAENGIPSNGWESSGWVDRDRQPILPIYPAEWLLDPKAAQ